MLSHPSLVYMCYQCV